MQHDFEYVTKKEYGPVKKALWNLIHEVQDALRDKFTFQFKPIGSSTRNMITRDKKGNKGYDFDINIYPNVDFDDYSPADLRKLFTVAFNRLAQKYGYSPCEDSSRVLTIKFKNAAKSSIEHSCDIAIILEDEDETEWFIHCKKQGNSESRRWFIMALERLAVLSDKDGEYYVPFFGRVKKLSLRSNCLGYGPAPDPSDVVEQLLTITDSGKVYFTEYCFEDGCRYVKHSRTYIKINPEKVNWILEEIGGYFASEEAETCMATDVGEWRLTLTSQSDVDYGYCGSLIPDDNFFSEMSYHLRKALDIYPLFLFDGECD